MSGAPWPCFCKAGLPEIFAVDIHPAADIAGGIMLDHATGLVIGETAVIGENVSCYIR